MFWKQPAAPEPVVIQIEANIQWQVARDLAARLYVGVCQPLNLNAVGETWIEFQECANDALATLLLDLFQSGEFEGFLRANGWSASSIPEPGTTPRFDVPFDVRRAGSVQELVAAGA